MTKPDTLTALLARRPTHQSSGCGPKPKNSIADTYTGSRRVAREVFVMAYTLGNRPGARAKAIRVVALKHNKDPGTINRAVSRHAALRAIVEKDCRRLEQFDAMTIELRRCMAHMPADVRKFFDDASAVDLLEFLRAEGIDGECPQWLIDAVRARN
jgi:hypothetical protein